MRHLVTLICAVLFGVALITDQGWAQRYEQPQSHQYRNKSGSTMYRGDPVEFDSTNAKIPTKAVFAGGDTITWTTDSLRTGSTSMRAMFQREGYPFKLFFDTDAGSANVAKDSFWVYGVTYGTHFPIGGEVTTTWVDTFGNQGVDRLSSHIWKYVDSIRVKIKGASADSVEIYVKPLLAIADADSGELRREFAGLVNQDSIVDNAMGLVAYRGAVYAPVNGGAGTNGAMEPGDLVMVGTSGHLVKWKRSPADTTSLNRFFAVEPDSARDIGRVLDYVMTNTDSAFVDIGVR